MKKKLLLYTAYGKLKGNIWSLYDYYNKNLIESYKNQVEVVYLDSEAAEKGKINQNISFLRRNFALIFPSLMIKGKVDYWVTDSGGNFLSRLSRGVEVAHGYGTKKTPGENELKTFKLWLLQKFFLKKLDAFITLSNFDETYFYKDESIKHKASYLPLGLPRNDRMLDVERNIKNKENFCKTNNLNLDTKFILYAPTWREGKIEDIDITLLPEINNLLSANDVYLLYRPHHHGQIFSKEEIDEFSNILWTDSSVIEDTQEVMGFSDCLITDYSSIFVDYLLLNKPIIFYVFDLDQYKHGRGLVIDYMNDVMTPGKKVFDLKMLLEEIKEIIENKDNFVKQREEARHFFHQHLDNKSCERVWDYLLKELELR